MKMENAAYDEIADWSPEGIAALLAVRGDEVRLLLDMAFTELLDEPGTSLRDFGFGGDDPVSEAVEWCVERFASGTLDPTRLRAESRGFRLFTEVGFWLAQRVGEPNVRRILARRKSRDWDIVDTDVLEVNAPMSMVERDVEHFLGRLAATLRILHQRTCSDFVGYWLVGTETLRREWFGWEQAAPILPERTPKQRSLHTADALFRFFVLFGDMISRGNDACRSSLFEPCDNAPPYRVRDSVVREKLGLRSDRDVARERSVGVASLVEASLTIAGEPLDAVERVLDVLLARASLRSSVLHIYNLETNERLQTAFASLPEVGR